MPCHAGKAVGEGGISITPSTSYYRATGSYPLFSPLRPFASTYFACLTLLPPKATPGQPMEDSVALLVRDFRERVEELREQVGTTDVGSPVELKDVAQKFRVSQRHALRRARE